MKYAYEDLGDSRFEELVVALCRRLLGMGTQGFAKGADGGRDAKFVGTADMLPSTQCPWKGTVIVQAKHTYGYNRSFSERDFFNSASATHIVGQEVPRIKKLRAADQLDHYMLFANRRLTGGAESIIRGHIARECNIPESSILLCGFEQLEGWLKDFPCVAYQLDFDPIDSPLIVSPDDLSNVVEALAHHLKGAANATDVPPTPRTGYEQKNKINKMTAEYARILRSRYLKDTAQIKDFLAAPENDELLRLYECVVDEFQLNIIAKRKEHQSFDEVMNHLARLLTERDPVLNANKRLTRVMLFYMYWNCDIGMNEDAQAD